MAIAKRVDGNQKQIVSVLRQLGFSVFITSEIGRGFPDCVAGKAGKNYLIEIKDGDKVPSKQKLTPSEQDFFDTWKGKAHVINSIAEAIKFSCKVSAPQHHEDALSCAFCDSQNTASLTVCSDCKSEVISSKSASSTESLLKKVRKKKDVEKV